MLRAEGPIPEKPDRPPHSDSPRRYFPHLGPESEAMRERAMRELQKLSPEQRSDVWKAVWAVLNLPPEKRKMLLGFEDERRRKAREEIEHELELGGIQLDEERKKAFFMRYFEERRAIEERLRKESEEKRRQLLGEMREKLRAEFASGKIAPVRASEAPK
jgi:hypothetical protein